VGALRLSMQSHVAAQRPAELCGAVAYEVAAPAIIRVDKGGSRPSEPLLRNTILEVIARLIV